MIDLPPLYHRCAPHVATSTMNAIVQTESHGRPYAIGLNHGYHLVYQPKSYEQARAWVIYLEKHHYNFDIGLGQVNIVNIHKFGYSAVDALDPCINIKMSAEVLTKSYAQALNKSSTKNDALLKAISAYNTGNYRRGFSNGYVSKVVRNAKLANIIESK
jgi:type IV secretion system protein VirB1